MSKSLRREIKSNEFLSILFDNMEAAVFLVDKAVRIQNINRSFTKLFHKSEEEAYNELCGNAIGCIFPVKEETDCGKTYHCNQCKLRKAISELFENKNDVQKMVIKREFLIDNQVHLKYFYTIANYFNFKKNDYVLIMINDITELEEAKEKLKELDNIKNEFLGIAAHDLKNPISIISMASSFLRNEENEKGNEENITLIEMIQNSSNYMLDLVNNLLDISKIEAGKLILNKTEQDYIEFVNEVLELNRITAKDRFININLEREDDYYPRLIFDRNRIRQVINNLIDNAIKFSADGAQIIINIKKGYTKGVMTEITDFGPGIPEDDLPKLFKEYQTTSVKTTNGGKSTGLGLAICKKIIEKHDGEIGVRSQLGKGTTFYFSLPA
ncbi:MAG: hypothetical protein BAJALOKI3v1_70003 [Promethearchaeota archaeon]|jgi:signal transduction histidine kinase|nr:MAG: hypothetical protein BAJALOKI3v1_70003 [Candidatus Lokiarchaeota archaeon]